MVAEFFKLFKGHTHVEEKKFEILIKKQRVLPKQAILLFLQTILTTLKFGVALYSKFATETNLFAVTEVSYFLLVFKNKGFEGIKIVY